MLFQFPPIIEAGIQAGKYASVLSSAGVPLGIARDSATGQFVGHAVGVLTNSGVPLSPLTAPLQVATSAAGMYQAHRGFQSIEAGLQMLQSSVGVLQATTAVIGVGVVASVALSAVNLHQTLKLRKAVERLDLKLENGFLDLKKALRDQGDEVITVIAEVAQDIKFEQHRVILIKAYGLFTKALDRLRSALKLQDINRINAEIDAARGMLFEALADYTNPQLLEDVSAPAMLRRAECAWGIEQTIILTYQMQREQSVVIDRIQSLQTKIRQDTLQVVECHQNVDELDFLFPEISRIHRHDLVFLDYWRNQTQWMKSLSGEDIKLLQSANFSETDVTLNSDTQEIQPVVSEALELNLYKHLQEKSHPYSLREQLFFMVNPDLREDAQLYISKQANLSGHKILASTNLQNASDLAVANLYWYFKMKGESEDESEVSTPN
jgi:hypothetical protein